MIIGAQKRAKYTLGEPKLDVKDMYMKEILSHLLADVEARSLVSDSFPKMHINDKVNVSVKAMCRVASKKLLNKALQSRSEHAGSKGLSTLDTLSRSDPDKSTSVASTLHAQCAKPDPIRIDLNPLP